MEISNPYTFDIMHTHNTITVTTLPITSNTIIWPTYTDTYGNTMMAANYDLTVPGGITVLYLDIDYLYGLPVAQFQLKDIDTNIIWFDTTDKTAGFVSTNIGVTPNSVYHLSITNPVQMTVKENEAFRIQYSRQINEYLVNIKDYKE